MERPPPALQPLGDFAFVRDHALSASDCQAVIRLARDRLTQSGLLGEQRDAYRTSSGTWLHSADEPDVLGRIQQLVVEITGLPMAYQESLQVLRYQVGEEYREHQDFWHPDTSYYDEQMARGGQRAWSVLIYLNDVPRGGGTRFPKLDIDITAEQGRMLAWKNTIAGELNYDSLHAGLPVEEGEKWVAVTWVRERPFR